jgi:catechol-2,3-dioxygenase
MIDSRIPSTGDPFPHFHLFFMMKDGSTVAFFEAPGLPDAPEVSHPAYDLFNHFAMQVNSMDEVLEWREWLLQNGVEVVGPTDHKGAIYSIYFHDPNGIRLELTAPQKPDWNRHADKGRQALAEWGAVKKKAIEEGRDVKEALFALTEEVRTKY